MTDSLTLDQLALIILIVQVALLVFLLGLWIRFEMSRTGVPMERLARQVEALGLRVADQSQGLTTGVAGLRDEAQTQGRIGREEAATRIAGLGESLQRLMDVMSTAQRDRLEDFARRLSEHRTATGDEGRSLREEVTGRVAALQTGLVESLAAQAKAQADALTVVQAQIRDLVAANDTAAQTLRQSVENRLDALRQENEAKLEQMRVTVDEKLQGTLDQRLGASFNQVSEQLERVFKSVGEMQTIATGVGDLKRVLSNVKTRGTWGEVTLGMLLEQVMTLEQYDTNVEVRPGSGKRVEFAVRLPGDGGGAPVWLPIDAKLPTEDYERIVDAAERADSGALEEAQKGLDRAIRQAARDISEKYVAPPHSTDFGVMFLPTEGLYAEVIRRPGLVDAIQREHRVIVTGPTTLMALLTSLRMGFRTLAIQERSSEVWRVLGGVKDEFQKFGGVLEKVEKKLGEAQNTVKDAMTRQRAVSRKLRDVETLPGSGPQAARPGASPTDMLDDLLEPEA